MIVRIRFIMYSASSNSTGNVDFKTFLVLLGVVIQTSGKNIGIGVKCIDVVKPVQVV